MSLQPENFEEMAEDAERWRRTGLGLTEARRLLGKCESSHWGIAAHCAGWIARNWGPSQIAKLGPTALRHYQLCVEDVHIDRP